MTDDEVKARWETDPKHRRKEYREVFNYMRMCHCDRCTGVKPYLYLLHCYSEEAHRFIRSLFNGYRGDGQWWFRVLGIGLYGKNVIKHGLMPSERWGYRKGIRLFGWIFHFIGKSKL